MKGDVHYKWITSGSCATSGNAAHNFYGNYAGLSLLNADEVVHLQIGTIGANGLRVGLEAQLQADYSGYRITAPASLVDFPPVKASDASALQFINDSAGANASAQYVIWTRGII
jgi:hypothetical protein